MVNNYTYKCTVRCGGARARAAHVFRDVEQIRRYALTSTDVLRDPGTPRPMLVRCKRQRVRGDHEMLDREACARLSPTVAKDWVKLFYPFRVSAASSDGDKMANTVRVYYALK
uniref:Uncharacterized protein n=1 Tax=Sipha flava TaxID=143950 RepID=A0A2S2R2I4_9HEMI